MARAYVKIWVRPGKENAVRSELLDLDCVMTADVTAGEQDMISLIEAPSYEALLDFVTKRVRRLDGVLKTVTNLIIEV